MHGGLVRECKLKSVEMKGERCSLGRHAVHLEIDGIFPMLLAALRKEFRKDCTSGTAETGTSRTAL